jgi:hypothetical protein
MSAVYHCGPDVQRVPCPGAVQPCLVVDIHDSDIATIDYLPSGEAKACGGWRAFGEP